MTFRNASAPAGPTRDVHRSVPDASSPDTVAAEDFKAVFRDHPAGVSIVTADDGTGPAGLTATSVTSVSAEPALLLFSLAADSSATPGITGSETVLVHLLGAEHLDLAKRFATGGIDRFADTDSWTRLASGEPVLLGVDSWLRGRVVDRMAAGSSIVVLVRVVQVQAGRRPRSPLVYQDRTWYSLGEAATLT
ncbi:flavin reductase family protein [Allosalinactinospora lopnorensis]|uniref:flavin reductase family protein n=1 Tax=Allosalinactinospora lopnorensis TaxID=1352348 RepID=UPI000623BF8E|nr:flavin reductase family protein [Allosalinactinospora lopnorensis]